MDSLKKPAKYEDQMLRQWVAPSSNEPEIERLSRVRSLLFGLGFIFSAVFFYHMHLFYTDALEETGYLLLFGSCWASMIFFVFSIKIDTNLKLLKLIEILELKLNEPH